MTNLYDKLILFSFCAFGFWYIVGRSMISRIPRERLWARDISIVRILILLVECPACFGTWTGVLVGAWQTRNVQLAIMLALYTCTTNLILYHFTGLESEK